MSEEIREMTATPMQFDLDGAACPVDVRYLVVAGWAGRDRSAVDQHIAELAELGVPAPSEVPLYYRVGADRLTTASAIQVVGGGTSGEVEAVVIAGADDIYLAVGSDHTDRDAEAQSVALAKQACPKPLSAELWRLRDVEDHWDDLKLRAHAWIDGERVLYQDGSLSEILPIRDLIDGFSGLAIGTAMFCGTIPTRHGPKPASRFEVALEDPVRGRTLSHAYDVEVLPAMA
jgi:hypothetical protein